MFRQIRWMMFGLALVSSSFATPAAAQAPHSPASEITARNLAHLNVRNAFDAVRTLRPLWLRQRGAPVSPGIVRPVRVYLNGLSIGDLEALATIHLDAVISIQHYGGLAAVQRWGPDHAGGVIHVRTR